MCRNSCPGRSGPKRLGSGHCGAGAAAAASAAAAATTTLAAAAAGAAGAAAATAYIGLHLEIVTGNRQAAVAGAATATSLPGSPGCPGPFNISLLGFPVISVA